MNSDKDLTSEAYIFELLKFELNEDSLSSIITNTVADDSEATSSIIRDSNGIPLGYSKEEIKMRSEIIKVFFHKWKEQHPEQMVFNVHLKENILIRNVSFIEACEHSSKSYKSTRAFMMIDEILANAKMVEETMPKQNDKNQAPFERIFVMKYYAEELGTVKLTVGVRKRTKEKIQYGISVPPTDRIEKSSVDRKKCPGKKKKHP